MSDPDPNSCECCDSEFGSGQKHKITVYKIIIDEHIPWEHIIVCDDCLKWFGDKGLVIDEI